MERLLSLNDTYTGNIIGLVLMVTMFIASNKRLHDRTTEYRSLMFIMWAVGLYCLTEPLSTFLEGVPGSGMRALQYLLNSLLYFANMVLGLSWVYLITAHTGFVLKKAYQRLLYLPILAGTAFLILNLFIPLVFTMDDMNRYSRGPCYYVFLAIAAIYLLVGIGIYVKCRNDGGVLKYFPVWLYVVPVLLGMLLETLLGSSYLGVCNGIAIAVVLSSLQNENIFRDSLTGLYNRAYLEEIRAKLERKKNPYVSGIMLDLDGFKGINDNYGHAEGDNALITAAKIIRNGAGSYGDVIRYAGDEFIVILNTRDEHKVQECTDAIRQNFETYNTFSGKPYRLSASSGWANFNADTQTVSEFLNTIDRNMYENKKKYYQTQADGECRRR